MAIENALNLAQRLFEAAEPPSARALNHDLGRLRVKAASSGVAVNSGSPLSWLSARCSEEAAARVDRAWTALREVLEKIPPENTEGLASVMKDWLRHTTSATVPGLDRQWQRNVSNPNEYKSLTVHRRYVEALAAAEAEIDLYVAELEQKQPPQGIFISHITEEAEVAHCLKDAIRRAVGDDANVFVSSDLESIRSGENWYERIVEAVRTAGVVIVLLSPKSRSRAWINFEAGVGEGARRRIIPATIRGLKKGDIEPPLSNKHARDLANAGEVAALIKDVGLLFRASGSVPETAVEEIVSLCSRPASAAGLSPPAFALARALCESSVEARDQDPIWGPAEIREHAQSPSMDIVSVIDELVDGGWIAATRNANDADGIGRIWPTPRLFIALDPAVTAWNPEGDAETVLQQCDGAGVVRDRWIRMAEVAHLLGWKPRRLNAALLCLREQRAVEREMSAGSGPFVCEAFRLSPAATRNPDVPPPAAP